MLFGWSIDLRFIYQQVNRCGSIITAIFNRSCRKGIINYLVYLCNKFMFGFKQDIMISQAIYFTDNSSIFWWY